MLFSGEFETHLTVDLPPSAAIEPLTRWADQQGLKCVHIILQRGDHPSQPMLTRQSTGTLSTELTEAGTLERELASAGFAVSRIKIEAAPWNGDVPQVDRDAELLPAERHFEHHVKLLLPHDADLDSIAEIAKRHGAHLSRNARKQRFDGRQERFVTQRCHRLGRTTAKQHLQRLLDELAHFEILETDEEFVVYDSNLALDAGWLEIV